MRSFALLGLATCALSLNLSAQEHWVATWTAPPQLLRPPAQQPAQPPAFNNQFHDQTVRMIARSTIPGRRVRVQFSNAFSPDALGIGSVHIALREKGSAIVPASDRQLLFNGKASVSIPPGAEMISDPIDFNIPQLTDIAISMFIPGEAMHPTVHALGLHSTYISGEGDFTAKPDISAARTTQSWYWLSGIHVMAPASAGAVLAFGDSITDGARSTPDTDHNWPSLLAKRVLAVSGNAPLAVLNEAISGNQVLRDGAGVNALARFDRDVLSQPGAKWLMILESINDIGRGAGPQATPDSAVTADDVILGLKQMADRAHEHGIKVIGCTLTPYEGAAYASEKGEAIREAVNNWIRTSGTFDSVVDFEATTRDSANPKRFRAAYDSGDHLHPNDAGYEAMANSVDLGIFGFKAAGRSK